MILSLLIGLVSIFVSVLGLKCTRLGRTSEQVKGQMVLSGGVLFILSGMKSRTLSVFFFFESGFSHLFLYFCQHKNVSEFVQVCITVVQQAKAKTTVCPGCTPMITHYSNKTTIAMNL